LAVVGLNITAWTMSALRRGTLDAAARRRHNGSLAAAGDALYLGAWAAFHARWRGARATMRESGHVLKRVAGEVAAAPRRIAALGERPWAGGA
jgi:hypothetical protein